MTAESSGTYERSPEVDVSRVGDRAVLYHRGSRTALVLNPTGSWIWHLLATPRTTDVLADELQGRFPELSREQAVQDVSNLMNDLAQHRMVSTP